MRRALTIAISMLTGCNSGGSVDVNDESNDGECIDIFGDNCDSPTGPTGTDGTDGSVVGTPDAGSGPGVGMWRIDAEAKGKRVDDGGGAFHFETELRVDIEDDQGNAATGLEVLIQTALLGDRMLVEDPDNQGRYQDDMLGYARTYTLVIQPDSPVERFTTTAVGPGAHQIAVPVLMDITADQTVTWSPSGASYARVDTQGGGNQDITDIGSHTIEAISLDYELGCIGEEHVEVRRWEVLDVANGAPGSVFEVSIEVTEEEVDTTDSRRSDLDGEVQLDGNFQGETGDVYVLIWPEKLDPEVEPPWHWTKIDDADFTDQADYLIADVEPGDWYCVAYLDADGSDVAGGQPTGPTSDDPYEEQDFTVDPGQDQQEDFDMQDRW